MNNPTIKPTSLLAHGISPEEFKAAQPRKTKGRAWTIETYALYVNLLYPHISVPLDQVWVGHANNLTHICSIHGEYPARPLNVMSPSSGSNCRGCRSEKQNASAGRRAPRATPEEKVKAALMRSEGYTLMQIAKALGRVPSTITCWLNPKQREHACHLAAQWRSNNREHLYQVHRRYFTEFEHGRATRRAHGATRRLNKLNTPEFIFLNDEWHEVDRKLTWKLCKHALMPQDEFDAIEAVYKECARITKATGIQHHVDHIQPLSKGGEHLAINLQILTAQENWSKNNTFRPEDQALLCRRLFFDESY